MSLCEKSQFWPRFLCTSYKWCKLEKAMNRKMMSNVWRRKNLIQPYIETVDIDESLWKCCPKVCILGFCRKFSIRGRLWDYFETLLGGCWRYDVRFRQIPDSWTPHRLPICLPSKVWCSYCMWMGHKRELDIFYFLDREHLHLFVPNRNIDDIPTLWCTLHTQPTLIGSTPSTHFNDDKICYRMWLFSWFTS